MSQDPRRSFTSLSDVPADYTGSSLKVVSVKADETGLEFTTPSIAGSVTGPGTSTDNAVVRFDGAGGTLVQNSGVIVDDSDNITGVASITINNSGLKIKDIDASHSLTIQPIENLTGNRILEVSVSDATRSLTLAGDVQIGGDFTTSGSFSTIGNDDIDLTTTGATSLTLPTSGTLATTSNSLSDFAVPSGNLNINSHKLTNVTDPADPQDACTKAYADAVASGLSTRSSVRVGTTADLNTTYNGGAKTLTCNVNGAISVDSVSLSLNDRILVKNQTTSQENGIYTVTTVGTGGTPFVLTRATDNDTSAEMVSGVYTFITSGATQAATGYVLTTADPITLDTTALSFTQFSSATNYAAGDGLSLSGLTFNVGAGSGITVASDTVAVDFTAVQAKDATLDALAAYNTNGFLVQTSANTFTGRTITGTNGVSVSNGDGGSGNPSLSVSISSLTEDLSPDTNNDYFMTYDTSAGSNKKATLARIYKGRTAFKQIGTSPLELWYGSSISANSLSTVAVAVAAATSTMYAVPFVSGPGGTVDRIAFNVTAAVASTIGRVGIYSATDANGGDLYPSTLVVDGGEFDCSTTGVKSASISASLNASDVYWFVFHFDNTTATLTGPTIRACAVASLPTILGMSSAFGTNPNTHLSITGQTYGALPGTFPAGATVQTGVAPAALVRFSA